MAKKLIPWLRVLIIVTSLVLGQAQMAVTTHAATQAVDDPIGAADSRVVTDTESLAINETPGEIESLFQQQAVQDCKIGVDGYAVRVVPTYPINRATTKDTAAYWPEDQWSTITEPNARKVGDTIKIFIGLQNTSAGCPTGATTLTSVQALVRLRLKTPGNDDPAVDEEEIMPPLVIPSTGLDFNWPNPAQPGRLASGQNAWIAFDLILPATLRGDLHIDTRAVADAEDDTAPFPDVVDFDDSFVRVVGPGFQQVSFEPNQAGAPAGTPVTFTLRIRNSREGTVIRNIGLTSPNASFAAQCGSFSAWERVGTPFGDPRELNFGEEAECAATVTIPTDPAPDSLSLSGQLTVSDGTNGMTGAVQSTPVIVSLPKVHITKTVARIDRGTTTIYNVDVNPNAPIPQIAPGDVITYRITVINSGMVTLVNIFVVDSLIGTIPVSSGAELAAGESLQLSETRTRYTVLPGSQDPLVNSVRVTALGKNTTIQVSAQAATSLDVIDSALVVEFTAEDPATGIVIAPDQGVERGQQVRYRMILRNLGQVALTNLQYVPLTPPQQTVGNEPALNVASLNPGQSSPPMTWLYTVSDTDPDPLASVVRIRGTTPDSLLVYGNASVTLNISNPNIEISNVVLEPVTPTVLRGGKVIYEVTVTNTNDASDACNVVVNQLLRDPVTLGETLIQSNVPLTWADPASPGRIYRDGHPTYINESKALVTYLVDGASPDPLEMIFEVQAVDCNNPLVQLTDRTLRSLDLSDAQINAAIQPQFGDDGVATVGENLQFVYTATNVGAVTLTQLSAEYCIKPRANDDPVVYCYTPERSTRFNLTRQDALSSFQDTSGTFSYPIQDGDQNIRPFIIEVTLFGKDNQGNDVSIKTAYDLLIATDALQVTLNGNTSAVENDMETYGALIRNRTGGSLSNISVYRVFEDGSRQLLVSQIGPLPDNGVWSPLLPPQQVVKTGEVEGVPIMSLRIQVEATRSDSVVITSNAKLDIEIIPMVRVTKTLEAGVPIAGQSLTFRIRIANQSRQQDLTLTSVSDPILDGYSVPYSPSNFDTFLSPGEYTEATFTIPSVNEVPNPLVNTFFASGTRSSDGATVSGFGSVKVDLECPIDIIFSVFNEDTPDADWVMGEELTWTIILANQGGVPIENVTVEDSLIHQGPVNPTAIAWPTATAGYIGVGQSAEYHSAPMLITSQSYSTNGDSLMTDRVRITFEQNGESSSCVKEFTQPLGSPVQPIKTSDKTIAFTGETVTYTFNLRNVTEADDAPYDIYFVRSITDSLLSPQIILCDFNKNTVFSEFETSGYINAGDTIVCETRTRDVLPQDPEELTNVMRIEFSDPGGFVDYLWTTDEVKIQTSTPFALTKTANVEVVAPGDTILYDYTIVNISPYIISNIEFVDDKVGNLIPRYNGGQRLTLSPGEVFTLPSIPYQVPADSPDPLTNIATITGTASYGGQTRQVSQTITETVDLVDSDLIVEKTAREAIAPPSSPDQVLLPGVSPVGVLLPDELPVTGADGMPEANVGQSIYYCFKVENLGDGTSYVGDITIVDPVFPNLQTLFQNAVLAKYPANGVNNLLYGKQFVEFCAYRGGLNTSMGDPVVNKAVVEGLASNGVPLYNEDELRIDLQGSDLLATKTASRTVAFVGDTITYRIVVSNRNQTYAIDNVVITDAFGVGTPQDLTAQCDWSTGGYPADPVTGYPVGRLALGGYATCTYTYEVQPNDPATLINTVETTGTLQDGLDTQVGDRTQSSVAITASQLLVRKTALSTIAQPGDTVTYQVTITNIGQTPVKNLLVVDRHYGAVVEYPSGTGGQTYKRDINPYETVFMTFQLTMPTAAELATPEMADRDPYFNEVSVYGTIFDKDGNPIQNTDPEETDPYLNGQVAQFSIKATDTESVDIMNPNLRVLKTPSVLAAMPGMPVEYTINITNVGKDSITHLFVDDLEDAAGPMDLDNLCPGVGCIFTYAPGLVDTDGDPNTPLQNNPRAGDQYDEQFRLNPANAALIATYPGLQNGLMPNERLVGRITVTVPIGFTGTQYRNVVQVNGMAGGVTVTDRASATIDVREAGILVTKTANTSLVAVGAPVGYTVTVSNVGAVSFDRVIFSDKGIDPANLDGDNNRDTLIVTAGFPATATGGAETLDPNETYTLNYTYTILATDADPYINRVTVRGINDQTGEQAVNVAQAVVDVQDAEVSIEKYACVGELTEYPGAGSCVTAVNTSDANTPDVITYFIRVRNMGMVTIENLSVRDTLFATPLSITWPMPNNGLAPDDGVAGSGNDEVWFVYQYTVGTGDLDPLRNIATVTGTTPAPASVPVQDSAVAQIRLVSGDLLLTKTASTQSAVVGQNVYYTFTVENLSTTDDITNISIYDPAVTQSGSPVCTLASPLAPGGTQSCGPVLRVIAQSDPRPFVNMATARGTQNGLTVTATATHTLQIVTSGVSVTKVASTQVAQVGDVVTYLYEVTNTGTAPIEALSVIDSDTAVNSDPAWVWPTVLPAGETRRVTIQRTIRAIDPDPYTNTVRVTGRINGVPFSQTATESVYIGNASLVVENTPSTTYATPGQNVTFTYRLRNLGTEALLITGATDNLCTLTAPNALMDQITDDPKVLAAGGTLVLTCTQPAPASGTMTSMLRVDAVGQTSGTAVTDTASAQVAITSGGVLLTKAADRLAAQPGQVINYTITVTNVGNEPLQNFVFTDPMISNPLPAPPASLAVGASFTIRGTYTVQLVDQVVTNTASITATGATTGASYSDSDTATVGVITDPNAALLLTKSTTATSGQPNQDVTYTLRVQNISSNTVGGPGDAILLYDNGTLVATIPSLGPANVFTINHVATIPANITTPTYTNPAWVVMESGGDHIDDAAVTLPLTLVTITKTTAEPVTGPGRVITYNYAVTNLSTADLNGVALVDSMQSSTVFTDFTWVTPLGPIPGSGSASASATVTVPGSMLAPSLINNTVEARLIGRVVGRGSAEVQNEGALPLTMTKTADKASYAPGETITYTITVTNPNSIPIPGVTITDPVVTWNAPMPLNLTLPPLSTTTYTGTATAPVFFADGPYTNTATASATGMTDVTASATVTVTAALPLTIAKEAVDPDNDPTNPLEFVGGDTVTYTIIVTNPNLVAVPGVSLADSMQGTPGFAWQGGAPTNVTIPAGTVGNPSTTSFTATWTIPLAQATAPVTNTVTMTIASAPGYTATASETINVARADPRIGIAVTSNPTIPIPGAPVTYTVTIRNEGNVPVSGLSGTWTLTPQGGTATSPVNLTLAATSLARGASTTATVTRTEDQTGPYTFTATGQFSTPTGVAPVTGTLDLNPAQPSTALQIQIMAVRQSGTTSVIANGLNGDPMQTGKPFTVSARLVNLTTNSMTVGRPTAALNIGGPAGVVCLPGPDITGAPTWPRTLTGSQSMNISFVCTAPASTAQVPQPGYLEPDGLLRTVTVTAYSSTGVATAQQDVTLIDLALDVVLDVLDATSGEVVTAAEVGDEVMYRITLTNVGASPLGCTAIDALSLENRGLIPAPCPLKLTGTVRLGDSASPDTTASRAFNTLVRAAETTGFLRVGDLVLERTGSAGSVAVLVTQRVALDAMQDVTYGIMAEGGFYSPTLAQTNPTLLAAYTTFDVTSTRLDMSGVELRLDITVTPNPPVLGQGVTYTFTVNNLPSGAAVTGLTGTYRLVASNVAVPPSGIMLTGTHQQEPLTGTLTFNTTNLSPGQSATATISRVESFTGTYIVSGSVRVNGMAATEFVTANRIVSPLTTALTPTPQGGVSTGTPVVEKVASADAAKPGDVITWTVTVRNSDTATMQTVLMQDAVPGGLEITSASTTLGEITRDGQTVKLSIPSLAPSASAVVTIVTTVSDELTGPGTLSNTACALRSGGTQACATAEVSLGPGVEELPLTGQRFVATDGGWNGLGLLALMLMGSLTLMMAAQTGSRRTLLAGVVLLVVLAVLVVVVMMLALGGDDEGEPTKEAFEPPATDASVTVGPEQPASPEPSTGGPDVVFQFPPTPTPYIMPTPAGIRQLLIPKLGDQFSVPVPIVQLPIVNKKWDVSGLGHYVGWLQGTTWLDSQWGNTVLAAHVQLGTANPGPFWGLGTLVPGDEIVILEGDIERVYVVTSTRKVSPDDWTVTAPTQTPVLTLITCTEWDQEGGIFAERMVVQAVPAEHPSIES